jgi:hypothetical protein
MNLDKLKPSWDQFKVISGMESIEESEILSCLKPKKQEIHFRISRRMAQNALLFSFLIMTISGGCSI